MSVFAKPCSCGKPPAVGVAVLVYAVPWKKPGKHKTSKTFHLCADCIIALHANVHKQLQTSLRAAYGEVMSK